MKEQRCFTQRLPPHLKKLKKELKQLTYSTFDEQHISIAEQFLIDQIKSETVQKNRNNVTRTQSYLEFYETFPEIHWALLGHMVSRNGGWNMTDLKGDLLSRLLSSQERKEFFKFLERGNWLIFQDVFPQMLLYRESIKRQTNLFHLLPSFDVSKFMYVLWNYFWQTHDKYTLAIGLVINEQSYLETRVIKNRLFQKTVLETFKFKIQELFSLNQILFPYKKGNEVNVIGQSIYHFSSLHDRISLGKRLYELLFDETLYENIYRWSLTHSHTGSRRDYWPKIFNDINESLPGEFFKRRTNNCKLRRDAKRIYSPKLQFAWKDVDHEPAEKGDWYRDWTVLYYLQKNDTEVDGDIYEDYCETLEKIELAIVAKEKFLYKL